MELEAVIGLEIHARISTKSKMFCRGNNDFFNLEANEATCEFDMGFPGLLPVLNKEAVYKGVKAALALGCDIPEYCKFDRKNYFYPDSPRGYQISQYEEPLSKDGEVKIEYEENGETKKMKVGVTRLHLEDDAGKLTHVRDGSLVDYNRAGSPLMEIVSEPDLRNEMQAVAYAKEVQKILRYVGSSHADMEKGMMRFDASVSVRPVGEDKLYPRAEIKNLNSFKALEAAIKYEIKRQKQAFIDGEGLKAPVTVGWNDDKGQTFFMREKEESDDYRYFADPDLPPLYFPKEDVQRLRSELPELPSVKKDRYINDLGLKEDDARIISADLKLANYFEEVVSICEDSALAASFINTVLMKFLREELISVDEQKVTAEMMGKLLKMVKDGKISNNAAKGVVFEEMYATGADPQKIVEEKGLTQVSDTSVIEDVCKKVIAAHPGPVEDVKNGKNKAIGFLIGMVMKEMKGQGNPKIISQTMNKLINS
jgi:aspartyl-tRNA(Asn)/glutamyl-tRNA(Gln) amidotransferase subunit B